MSSTECPYTLKLDPWAASSLLQKAIRRGEVGLAQYAASIFRSHRGDGVFRRLITIAIEDVGIADLELVGEVVRLCTDKPLRHVLGDDAEHLSEMVRRLAEAPKERSADYLYCMATKLPAALMEGAELALQSQSEQILIAADLMQPLTRRATTALLACSADEQIIDIGTLEELLDLIPGCPETIRSMMVQLARSRAHAFGLMLPILWSRWRHFGCEHTISLEPVRGSECVGGIPLYAFDKHTSVGKRAIERFARENPYVAALLQEWVPTRRHSDVVGIAAFYADAAPVRSAFQWPTGALLSHMGLMADMMDAGCPLEGIEPLIACVADQVPHLNQLRRDVMRS